MQGMARFALDFQIGSETFQAQLAGKSWGDSLTHDFTQVRNYQVVLGLIAKAKSFTVLNSNGTAIARFKGNGSMKALQSYEACLSR
jgi:hypothetical protein